MNERIVLYNQFYYFIVYMTFTLYYNFLLNTIFIFYNLYLIFYIS